MPKCEHMHFVAEVNVGRLTDEQGVVTHYTTDIKIMCAACKIPFEFVGLPLGHSPYRPTVSMDGLTLAAPITPQGTEVPKGLPGFNVTMSETPNA